MVADTKGLTRVKQVVTHVRGPMHEAEGGCGRLSNITHLGVEVLDGGVPWHALWGDILVP